MSGESVDETSGITGFKLEIFTGKGRGRQRGFIKYEVGVEITQAMQDAARECLKLVAQAIEIEMKGS